MLINKSDIAAYRAISASTKDSKVNPFIGDAELLDLMPLLGEKFYYDILANPSNYTDLLNEKEYTYDGYTVKSPGLKRVLVDFSYARYVMHGSQTDTPFGMVEKQYQDGANVSRIDKKEVYKHTQQMAMQYWAQVEAYLNRNSELYPLWNTGCVLKKTGSPRFNFITR